MKELEGPLTDLARRLESAGIPYMVIGGAANLVWGEPRLTRDIDVTIQYDIQRLSDLLALLSPAFTPRPEDPEAFVRETRVLPLVHISSAQVDLIFAGIPYEQRAIERARPVPVGEAEARIAPPEDVIVHKVISSRPRDYEDVVGIIRRQGPRLDREYLDKTVRVFAVELEDNEIWERYQRAWREARGPGPQEGRE